MATVYILGHLQSTHFIDAGSNDWIVGVDTIISASSGAGLYEAAEYSGNTYRIDGYVGSVNAQGLFLFADQTNVTVQTDGKLYGGTDGAYFGGADAELTNYGNMNGLSGGAVFSGGAGHFTNFNMVSGHYGVLLNNGGEIHNYSSGVVKGDYAIYVLSDATIDQPYSTYTDNFGVVQGRQSAFYSSGQSDDFVRNSGVMNGDVYLGAGNDGFENLNGTFRGTVYGQSGSDTYWVSQKKISIVEYAHDGYDVVVSTVSFRLPINIETLYLQGKANINGYGNDTSFALTGNRGANKLMGGAGSESISGGAGNDTLNGGKGTDWLTGGKGADLFVLKRGDGNDVVTDFTDGRDHIKLSGFGIDSTAELRRHLFRSDDDVVFRYGHDSLTFEHTHKSDLSSADFG